jgi:hypothetical protein
MSGLFVYESRIGIRNSGSIDLSHDVIVYTNRDHLMQLLFTHDYVRSDKIKLDFDGPNDFAILRKELNKL